MKLSIIVLNYNTKDLLRDCLNSLKKVKSEVAFEVIVVDNGSIDQSVQMVSEEFSWAKLIKNKHNLGFAAGNNRAKKLVKGKYVLFLNSDTVVKSGALKKTTDYLDKHHEVGAMTCRLEMPGGKLDPDSRRSFPTPWNALTHFSGLGSLFPHSKIFSKYRYGHIVENKIQEVDVIQAAFFLTRKDLLDEVGWFDEDYFLDGEDIDLCWRIRQKGYKIVYYPKVSIVHIKKGSKGKSKRSKQTVVSGITSMEIFYKKHLVNKYSAIVNFLVLLGVRALKLFRIIKFSA